MPEGDTIFRTAESIRRWVEGREVTAAQTKVRGLGVERIIGKTITEVEPRAKHLLIRFSNNLTLHTHMRMTGSWHVYSNGDRWRKPPYQAKITIECGDRLIVCFNAPVVEMLMPSDERMHRSLQGLGPDVLGDGEFDFEEVRRRAATRDEKMLIGELLLDQQVVSGIGNIYRCESLFLDRIDPFTERRDIAGEKLDHVVRTAIRLMRANVGLMVGRGRSFDPGGPSGPREELSGGGEERAHRSDAIDRWSGGTGGPSGPREELSGGGEERAHRSDAIDRWSGGTAGPNRPWVYGRTGRPCRVCGTPVRGGRLGVQARDVYWCPRCQSA